jgi:hypothetical protein
MMTRTARTATMEPMTAELDVDGDSRRMSREVSCAAAMRDVLEGLGGFSRAALRKTVESEGRAGGGLLRDWDAHASQ